MRIVVAGALANKPRYGGEAWVRLAWAMGLEALGFEVLFLEQLPAGARPAPTEGWYDPRIRFFEEVCAWSGLAGKAALVTEDGRSVAGRCVEDVLDFAAGADLLANLSGHLTLRPVMEGVRYRAYVDLDPGFTQFWHADGEADLGLERHDSHFTVGGNVGTPGCPIPTGDLHWIPVRQPVLMDRWPSSGAPSTMRFTTVASWRGSYGPVEFGGHLYGLKVHEFRRFIGLPGVVPVPVEVALDIHPADEDDRAALIEEGWILVDPLKSAGTPAAFREFVVRSAAELSVAQGIYVETRSGWFSDRSARYLAAGRPVIVQDTGMEDSLPVGEGILPFRTMEDARLAALDVLADHSRHGAAARRIAEEYFASDIVLSGFLEEAVGARRRTPVRVPPGAAGVGASRNRRWAGAGTVSPRWSPLSASSAGGGGRRMASSRGSRRPRAVVSGMVAATPGQGGAVWAVLQYLLGLWKLGWEVHLVEEIDPADARPAGQPLAATVPGRYFGLIVESFDLQGRATLVESGTYRTVGLGRDALERWAARADLLINLSGKLTDPDLRRGIPVQVYVDLDPAFTQLWQQDGVLDLDRGGHTHFATVGLQVGREGCPVPTLGVEWIPTLPPVVLDAWTQSSSPRLDAWTTVANWRGYGSVRKDGIHYGQKAHSFRELLELPFRTRDRFEVALSIHPDETRDVESLTDHGWTLLDPILMAGSPGRYHRFVRGSAGEIGVAKSGYVVSRSGWFSDRSACYLAAGRPVVAQDTGFSRHLPVGWGLLAFDGLEGAAEGVARVRREYARHAEEARRIAETRLDSDRVLSRLLEEVGACAKRT